MILYGYTDNKSICMIHACLGKENYRFPRKELYILMSFESVMRLKVSEAVAQQSSDWEPGFALFFAPRRDCQSKHLELTKIRTHLQLKDADTYF